MIITGFALYSEHSQYAIFAPSVMWWNFSTGRAATQWTFTVASAGDVADWRVCDRSCLHGLREDIMSDDTVISTMVNGYRATNLAK